MENNKIEILTRIENGSKMEKLGKKLQNMAKFEKRKKIVKQEKMENMVKIKKLNRINRIEKYEKKLTFFPDFLGIQKIDGIEKS